MLIQPVRSFRFVSFRFVSFRRGVTVEGRVLWGLSSSSLFIRRPLLSLDSDGRPPSSATDHPPCYPVCQSLPFMMITHVNALQLTFLLCSLVVPRSFTRLFSSDVRGGGGGQPTTWVTNEKKREKIKERTREHGGGGNEFPRFILFSRLCDTASSERIRPKLLIPPRDQTKQCWQKNRGNRRSLRPVAVAKFAQPCPGRCENTDRPVKKWFHLTK